MSKIDMKLFSKSHGKGMNDLELSQEFNMSIDMVKYYRRKLGLFANKRALGNPLSDEQEDKRMKLYSLGKSDSVIAKTLGLKPASILAWRKKRGLKANKRSFYGRKKQETIGDLEDLIGTDLKKYLEKRFYA